MDKIYNETYCVCLVTYNGKFYIGSTSINKINLFNA